MCVLRYAEQYSYLLVLYGTLIARYVCFTVYSTVTLQYCTAHSLPDMPTVDSEYFAVTKRWFVSGVEYRLRLQRAADEPVTVLRIHQLVSAWASQHR